MSFRWLAILLFPLVLQAAPMETMAWHFAVMPSFELLSDNRETIAELPDSESSLASVFITKDQKLKDLSEPFRKRYKLDNDSWLVWNESRKMLIAHGTPITLWQVEADSGYSEQPRQVSLTLSWFLGIEPGQPVPPEAKPVYQSTIIGRSAQVALMDWTSPDSSRFKSVHIEIEPTFSFVDQVVDSRFIVKWEELVEGKLLSWDLSTSLSLDCYWAPRRILAQVDSSAGSSWTVAADESIVFTDGTPQVRGRLHELDGKEVVFQEFQDYFSLRQKRTLPSPKGTVVVEAFQVDLRAILGGEDQEADPFSAKPSTPEKQIDTGPAAIIPDAFKGWVPPVLIDVRKWLQDCGIVIGTDGLAGVDFENRILFVGGLDPGELEKVEQIFLSCNLGQPPCIKVLEHIGFTNTKGETTHLRTLIGARSGQKSSLTCTTGKKTKEIDLTVEPTLGDSGQILDLRYSFKRRFPLINISSTMTLPAGVEVKGMATTMESGESMVQSWKAWVLGTRDPEH